MAFREYLLRRLWVLPLLVTLAYIWTDTGIHYGVTKRVSDRRLFSTPITDSSSPTGYEYGERDIILPYTGMDGYHWVMQTQAALAQSEARVRWVDYDNYKPEANPIGREVHWSSSFRWWVEFLAWLRHVYFGEPLPIAIEFAMPYANTLLIALLLIPLAPYITRRLGLGPASMVIIGMAAILPLYGSFSEGKSDHHGLAALSTLLTLLFLLAGGGSWVRTEPAAGLAAAHPFLGWLPERAQAKRWFMASAIVGGIGLWVSTASEAPVLAEIGLAALVACGWLGYGAKAEDGARPDPSLWRVWGWTGAATSVFFYFVEYFPAHFGLRLEVNHPLYAAAWAGGGEIIYRVCRWWNGGKLAETGRDWVWLALSAVGVAAAPTLILLFADQVFWVKDSFLFLFHEDYIAEFKDMERYLNPMYANASAKYLLAVVSPLPLLTVPMVVWMWRQLRVPVLVLAALVPPVYDVYRVLFYLIPATRATHSLEHFLPYFAAGLLVMLAAILCLVFPKKEKLILLITLAATLLAYVRLEWSLYAYLYAHPALAPADYYFWPTLAFPIAVTAGLLILWDPWPDFPRAAKAMMLLSLPTAVLTLALALRETRWMEQDASLWLATLAGVAVIVTHQRGYHWPKLSLAFFCGLAVLFALQILRGALAMIASPAQAARLSGAWLAWLPWLAGAAVVATILLALNRGESWKAITRVFVGTVFIGAVFLPSPVMTMRDWPQWYGATPISETELMEILTRDASHRLRERLGDDTGVVVSGPTTTTWMTYWGGFKGLGTLYWENLEGLKADRDIYAAQSADEAFKLIQARGVTHIAIFSWDPFYKEYARLAIPKSRPYNPDDYVAEKPLRAWLVHADLISPPKNEVQDEKPLLEHAFIYSLIEGFNMPAWLRPVYYPMPQDPMLRTSYILIFEVVPHQTPQEAAVRLAQLMAKLGAQDQVVHLLTQVLTVNPNYMPAMICAAQFDAQRKRLDEFATFMQKIRAQLPLAGPLALDDRLDLATNFVTDGDIVSAKHQLELCIQQANAHDLRRLTVDQQFQFLSFLRQSGMIGVRPGLAGFILTLLPDSQRAQFYLDSGLTLKQTNPAAALTFMRRAVDWQPDSTAGYAEIARLLATTRDAALRDPATALQYAKQARSKDPSRGPETLDILACAYAANRQFDEAQKYETQAVDAAQKLHADQLLQICRAHLVLFKNQQAVSE